MRRLVKPRPCRPASDATARLLAPLRTMASEAGAKIRNRWLEEEQESWRWVQASRAPESPERFLRSPRGGTRWFAGRSLGPVKKGRRTRRSRRGMRPRGDPPRARQTEGWTGSMKGPEWLLPQLPEEIEIRSRFDVKWGRGREMKLSRSMEMPPGRLGFFLDRLKNGSPLPRTCHRASRSRGTRHLSR